MTGLLQKDIFYTASFPKTPDLLMLLISAELQQSEGAHDYLILNYKGAIDNHITGFLEVDDPVVFTWGDGQNHREFIGFIHTIEKITTPANVYTKIKCINNSAIFKRSNKKIYNNLTSNQIVEEICAEHDFSTKTSYHPYTHGNLVQSGNSDWQFLNQLSKYTGYALRASNMELIFKDKDQLINENFRSMPVFTHFSKSSSGLVSNQTLISFTALDSAITPEFENTGDPGVTVYGDSGEQYIFDSNQSLDNGASNFKSANTPPNWNTSYKVN
jgi:hypothetical protein